MIGFNYIYKTPDEIFSSAWQLGNLSLFDGVISIAALIAVFISIFIVFPSFIITQQYLAEQKEKRNKKKLLTQILLQKEIEDEVEKEIHIDEESKVL